MAPTTSFRVVLLGSSGVGKTTIVRRLFESVNGARLMDNDLLVKFKSDNDSFVELLIVDVPGAQRHMHDSMFQVKRNQPNDAIVLVFSLNDQRSLNALQVWIQRVQEVNHKGGNPINRFYVIGNKSDCLNASPAQRGKWSMQTEKGVKEFLSMYPLARYFEMSALEDHNHQVKQVFELIAAELKSNLQNAAAAAVSDRVDASSDHKTAAADDKPRNCGNIRAKLQSMLQSEQPLKARDELGRSALSVASVLGSFNELTQSTRSSSMLGRTPSADVGGITLASFSTQVNQVDNAGMTPVMLTVAAGNVDSVDTLYKMGADLNIKDRLDFTAVTHAAVRNNAPVVAKLLELKAKPNQVDVFGNTPLIWAARCGHAEVIRQLRKCLTDVRAWLHKGEYGMNASEWAAYFGHDECQSVIKESVKELQMDASLQGIAISEVEITEEGSQLIHPATESRWPWYSMQRKTRGIAMIINIINFDEGVNLTQRNGAECDFDTELTSLYHAFIKMGFTPKIYKNRKSDFFGNLMTQNCPLEAYSDHDAFLLCLCSHGGQRFLYASDGGKVKLEDLFRQVRKTPGLYGKPKLFVTQSCRNEENDDEDHQLGAAASPSPLASASLRGDGGAAGPQADCFYLYSVFEGGMSLRDPESGCLFAQFLRNVLLDESTDLRIDEFSQLMPLVVDKVADETGSKQIPCSRSTLRKLLYFPPLPACLSDEVS